jgi:uroporphyrinogen-III synthase
LKPTVFYSAALSEDAAIAIALRQKSIHLHAESLIEHQPIPFECPQHLPGTWLFFTSPRAVRFYQEHCALDKSKIACLGKGTLKALEATHSPSFVGEGEVEEVAQQFLEQLGDEEVIFPCSQQSLLRIPSALPKEQVRIIHIYSTQAKSSFHIPAASVYFFTSPSNVHAFFMKQQLPQNSRIVAMGISTQEALLSYGCPSITPKNYLPASQLQAIKESLGR